ncbi:ferredoxin reductase [Conexibacter sp. DBS9H8]|uniref:ferredoxin reductase n=1 Tax=Conexibacter sp. DBS9H8 TaxID=2937801 RepID=UPI00200E3690|nr:ferredoxin reductase [Conexibacter sp. DBS9H8]
MTVTTPGRGPLRRLGGHVRRVADAVATPLLPQDYLDLIAPLHGSVLRGRIESVHPETRDAVTLVIRPGRGWVEHRPGQYIRIGVDVDGVRLWRAYSLTSPPATGATVSITVKAIADGVVSSHLVRRARPGMIVGLDPPTGDFTLPLRRPAKLLFITAGSGITPVMGMLRSHLDELDDVIHVHAAPRREDVIFGGELRALARAGRLELIEHHDDTDGLLSTERLSALVPDLREREAWACGPAGLLATLESFYDTAGIADRLHTERFRPTILATGAGGSVTFTRQGTTVQGPGDVPLLSVGEGAGVLMPSGCRMGICFGCVVPLAEGTVRDLRSGALTHAAPGDNVQIQTCISAAAGPCRIDL